MEGLVISVAHRTEKLEVTSEFSFRQRLLG